MKDKPAYIDFGDDYIPTPPPPPVPPSTRYQGSKYRLLEWIWLHLSSLKFHTCLDAFGGTGSVAHFLKGKGKKVVFNDASVAAWQNGLALVENQNVTLSYADIEFILNRHDFDYADLIEDTFSGIYFTDEENCWLDVSIQNVSHLKCKYKRSLALYAICQAALVKRPYNLFHRANLYMRFADVERSFGNKTAWDKPFSEHFNGFVTIANESVFKGDICSATNMDMFDCPTGFDMVYLDPPYMKENGAGTDYANFYHFLDGLCSYDTWLERIDFSTTHRRLKKMPSDWTDAKRIEGVFEEMIKKFQDSVIVCSYRQDGIPSLDRITEMLSAYKQNVKLHYHRCHKYALSKSGANEVLFVAS